MDSTFGWEDELKELMQGYSAELPSLMAEVETDMAVAEAEARKRASGGVDLMPVLAQIEGFYYRFTRLERQNLEYEKRIAELESERSATKETK